MKSGNERVDAVVVDEEAIGSLDSPGCGAKILQGDGALEHYLSQNKANTVRSECELEGESDLASRAVSL